MKGKSTQYTVNLDGKVLPIIEDQNNKIVCN